MKAFPYWYIDDDDPNNDNIDDNNIDDNDETKDIDNDNIDDNDDPEDDGVLLVPFQLVDLTREPFQLKCHPWFQIIFIYLIISI